MRNRFSRFFIIKVVLISGVLSFVLSFISATANSANMGFEQEHIPFPPYSYQSQYGYQSQYAYPGESSYPGEYPGQYGGQYSYQYQGEPNLDVTEIGFYDEDGVQRNPPNFDPLEWIYLRVGIRNTGNGYPSNTSRHAIYRNSPSAVSTGTSSDIPMYIDSSTNWPPSFTAIYESWVGGTRSSQYTLRTFSGSTIGQRTLRVFADYNNRVTNETSSSDNQMTATYNILSPDLTVPNLQIFDQLGEVKGTPANPFFTTDMLFPAVTISNIGTGRANSQDEQTDSRVYAHLTSAPTQGLAPNPGVSMLNGEFAAGATETYAPAVGYSSWAFVGTPYFTRPTPGSYTAWAYVNFNHQAIESNYANNTRSVSYTVVTPYSVSGRVFVDQDGSGGYNTGDTPLPAVGLSIAGSPSSSPSAVTNASGQYSFARLRAGSYTVTLDVPQGYRVSNNAGSNTRTYTLGPNQASADFALTGSYSVAGEVFVDDNSNGIKDGAEQAYSGSSNVSVSSRPSNSPNPQITNTNGVYSITGLLGPRGFYTGSSLVGYSGTGYVVTGTDLGRYYSPSAPGNPSTTYSINFTTPGTYRIWTRGWGPSGNGDSYHLAYDGTVPSSAQDIDIVESTYPRYAWSSARASGAAPTITVSSAGVHTISIRTREDGTLIDKLYLTTSQAATPPSGAGPAQSAVSGGVFQQSGSTVTIEAENFSSSTTSESSYSISSSAPPGYFATSPIPPTYSMTMTGTCPINPSPAPASPITCSVGSLGGLNFGFSPGASWFQTRGGDVRIYDGFVDPIPATPQAICGGAFASRTGPFNTTPGVIFSGSTNPSFGSGQASSANWKVGSSAYPEVYTPVNPTSLRTAYEYLESAAAQQNISFSDLATVCSGGLNNCSISNLPTGHYRANGDLNLNAFTIATNAQVVIIVNGDLNINTTVDVPFGASLVVSSRGSITVDSSVGASVTGAVSCPPDGHVEGIYSANDNFVLESNASCGSGAPDRMLAIEGAIVVQADLNGGSLVNSRTLCDLNVDYPTYVVTERPDFLLNLPDLLKVPTYTWREVAP